MFSSNWKRQIASPGTISWCLSSRDCLQTVPPWRNRLALFPLVLLTLIDSAQKSVSPSRNFKHSRWSLPCTHSADHHNRPASHQLEREEWEHNEAEQRHRGEFFDSSRRWLIVTENCNFQAHPVINWRLYCISLLRGLHFGSNYKPTRRGLNEWRLISHNLFWAFSTHELIRFAKAFASLSPTTTHKLKRTANMTPDDTHFAILIIHPPSARLGYCSPKINSFHDAQQFKCKCTCRASLSRLASVYRAGNCFFAFQFSLLLSMRNMQKELRQEKFFWGQRLWCERMDTRNARAFRWWKTIKSRALFATMLQSRNVNWCSRFSCKSNFPINQRFENRFALFDNWKPIAFHVEELKLSRSRKSEF